VKEVKTEKSLKVGGVDLDDMLHPLGSGGGISASTAAVPPKTVRCRHIGEKVGVGETIRRTREGRGGERRLHRAELVRLRSKFSSDLAMTTKPTAKHVVDEAGILLVPCLKLLLELGGEGDVRVGCHYHSTLQEVKGGGLGITSSRHLSREGCFSCLCSPYSCDDKRIVRGRN
jgi:hypothetical protein